MTTKQAERPVEEKQTRNSHKDSQKKTNVGDSASNEQDTAKKTSRNQQKQKQREEKKNNKRPRLRVFPIWLRIIVVLLLCAIALTAGLMIGYGVIGDGTPTDALKKDTWQHIIDIVTKTE
ncbi:DNA-directed RNA polymerase subunit beta [Virgibacillus halodenitrificans]|jgi:DNA mismatch repair ATPase MutL|uniref:DNA-directed RNA polymerase subunit beta n=1 Tax=Virgibacillus halodenitrificans TaxID=1482 RepID=A0AAC9NM36_VIRHA|nr:DNA-directed RNA polymerase subunit beta [Virgibacillus halodenitrificans]APC49720.1 hypothetical protein BME96_16665 [Virgibacillus halodenitrificans]MBD1221452.1 DNA-directed RNA polymerase subunit beta [Virgibacillus halodenitrificans]MCG1028188.1 DNA-directed RNA polymerase subunit beta [Virgibacillus halodenitrificans]MCJ0929580.1 DNA-directed RNA polymerase subunit beta [Virgibacillus halodenitrificans]MEC2158946.1 DNA-directed RNA polymerase subunit beta [Virgibacillus halodenitrific